MMIDASLARRILNKMGREMTKAFTMSDGEARRELQRALNDLTFMYDILHLDEIEAIDINPNKSI